MNLEAKFKKAEKLAKQLGATEYWISSGGQTFKASFGKSFYGKVEVWASVNYGSVYSVEISGASFRFDNKQTCSTFIKNLQDAMRLYTILK